MDYIGGEVVDGGGTVQRGGLFQDLYAGGGATVYDNFFGRDLSGSCSQLLCWGARAPTLYYDNVCYGSTGAALIVEGGGRHGHRQRAYRAATERGATRPRRPSTRPASPADCTCSIPRAT